MGVRRELPSHPPSGVIGKLPPLLPDVWRARILPGKTGDKEQRRRTRPKPAPVLHHVLGFSSTRPYGGPDSCGAILRFRRSSSRAAPQFPFSTRCICMRRHRCSRATRPTRFSVQQSTHIRRLYDWCWYRLFYPGHISRIAGRSQRGIGPTAESTIDPLRGGILGVILMECCWIPDLSTSAAPGFGASQVTTAHTGGVGVWGFLLLPPNAQPMVASLTALTRSIQIGWEFEPRPL